MRLIPNLILSCTLLGGGAVFAKPVSVEEVKKAQADLKSLDFLEVQFNQTQFTALRGKTRSSKGRALFAKPGKFRWIIESPEPEELVYNGETLYQYKPKEKVATKFSTSAKMSQEIQELSNLILNVNRLLDNYEVVSADSDKNVIDLELKPKAANEVTKVNLRASLREQRNYVKSVKIEYKGGNTWAIDFKNPRSKPIEADKFNFSAPADVKVSNVR